MVIELLAILEPEAHMEVLKLLHKLIKSNEETKKLFCNAQVHIYILINPSASNFY